MTFTTTYKFTGTKISTEIPQTPQKHIAVAGDGFESIANKYGVTLRELIGANPQLLKIGDTLTVPTTVSIPSENTSSSGSTDSGSTAGPKTYTVKPGDSLYAIAVKYGTTVAAIASFNNITDPNNISIGQVLKIP